VIYSDDRPLREQGRRRKYTRKFMEEFKKKIQIGAGDTRTEKKKNARARREKKEEQNQQNQ